MIRFLLAAVTMTALSGCITTVDKTFSGVSALWEPQKAWTELEKGRKYRLDPKEGVTCIVTAPDKKSLRLVGTRTYATGTLVAQETSVSKGKFETRLTSKHQLDRNMEAHVEDLKYSVFDESCLSHTSSLPEDIRVRLNGYGKVK